MDLAAQIRELARGARAHWWLILLCIAVSVGGAFAYSELKTPVYESSARVVIQPTDLSTPLIATPGGDDPIRARATDIDLVKSPIVAQRAQARPELRNKRGKVIEGINVGVSGDSNVITISVRSQDSRTAALMAQGVAEEYIKFRRSTKEKRFKTALSAVRTRLRQLSGRPRDNPEVQRLRAQARELSLVAAVQTGDAQVVENAQPSATPVEPNRNRNLQLGAVVGGFLGLALAFLRDRLDRRIKTVDRLEELLPDLPILAFVPKAHGSAPSRIAGEAYHTLRASLQSMNPNGPPRSILVTSAMGGDGKSSTTANLAVAMTEHGASVMILEADLRRPGLSLGVGIAPSVGVSDVLAGTKSLAECVGQAHFLWSENGEGPRFVLEGEVALVPAGPPPEQPRRLFTEQGTTSLLSEALSRSHTVLVDGAPLGMFSDMAPVARKVDAVVLVVRIGHTREDALERMMDRLATLRVTPLGMVVLESAQDSMPYGGYYYGD